MSWIARPTVLLLLAFHLIDRCHAETVNWCNGDMWSEPRAVFVGESFEVFCRCNTSRVRLQDMYLATGEIESSPLESTPVDEYTVKHKEEVNSPSKFVRIYCKAGKEFLGELYVNVVPILEVAGFHCRTSFYGSEALCAFKEMGHSALIPKKSYSLSINGLSNISCIKRVHYSSWIECPGLLIPNGTIFGPIFQIELLMQYEEHNQTQVFPMRLREMTVPEWPLTQPKFRQSNLRICLNWVHTDHTAPAAVPQKWRVVVDSENPNIQKISYGEIVVIPMFHPRPCFSQMPYANQIYRFRIIRRYDFEGAPWSTEFKSDKFTSMAAIPDRPPDILSNGFYHDHEKKELYVFWQQLDELELNGPNFTYAAFTNSGKRPSSIDRNCAIFSDWDPTLNDSISVWSQNSRGNSTNSTVLEVPLLSKAGSRQPLELRYHDDNYTLTWQAPQDQEGLTGYAISWCLGSTSRYQICDDQVSISLEIVEKSQHHFQFNQSMFPSNLAAAANYQDKPSDGMRWIGPHFPRSSVHEGEQKTTSLNIIQVIAVLIFLVAFLSLGFVSVRKLQKMAKIEVSLPAILFKSVEIEISVPVPAVCVAVPGNFPPKAVVTIDILNRECLVEEEVEDPPDQDYHSKSSSDSASSSNEELAHEAEPVIQNRPNPYVTSGTGYVRVPFK